MFTQITWKGKMVFEGKTESGHSVSMDAKPEFGGEERGPRPMELLMVALGGCTGMDVISILKKIRIDLESMTINIDSEQATEHPKVFTKINIEYNFTGKNIKEENVKKAIELSQEKYCSVSAMLKEKAEITYKWNIINK
jgi:putative redox protein